MKNFLKTFGLFIVLSVVFSAFSACSNATNPENNPSDGNPATETAANPASGSKSSEYPPAPAAVLNTEIRNINGNAFKIGDLKGKVVLLNLWATWCGPCREEMPHLVAMENEFKSKDFKIIGLNVDEESTDVITPFAEKMKLNYDLAWADEKMMREFIKISKQDGIPQSFLIDREGHLRGVFFSANSEIIKKMRESVEKVANE